MIKTSNLHRRNKKDYNILVIEDNPADAALLQIYLEEAHAHHKLLLADSLDKGIQVFFRNDIDLVLLDLTLPDSDGIGTLKKFLKEVPDLPVIVLTGHKEEIMGIQAVRAGAQDFLGKNNLDSKTLDRSIEYSLQRFKQQYHLRQTAKALSINQQQFSMVLKMAKFGNWDMDIVTYSMNWTDEMFQVLGLPPQSFQPNLNDYLKLVHIDDRSKVEEFFASAVKDGEIHRIKHRLLINTRLVKHMALQARVNYDELQGKILLIGSIQDITEHRISKTELQDEKEGLPKLSAQEQAIKQISNTQLTHLQAIAEELVNLRKDQNNPHNYEVLDRMGQHTGHLFQALNKLQNISQLFSNSLSHLEENEFSVKNLLHKISQLAELIQFHKGTTIRLQPENNLPVRIISDFEKIQHIFLNLLCLTQLPGAKISNFDLYLSSREIEENVVIIHLIANCKGKIPGMEKVESLLESNNILDELLLEPENEWAMTLAIIGKITRSLQGISQFREKGERGCQIELEFPVKTLAQEAVDSIGQLNGPLHVLLVDDHTVTRLHTRRMLNSWSEMIQVDVASNGEEGVRMFKRSNYDIVLMDLQMPVMDGLEATRIIRASSKIPIIGMTPQATREEEEQCHSAGMNDYILKPFKGQDLFAKISKLIRRS